MAKIFTNFAIVGTLASAFLFYGFSARAETSAQITATVAVGVCGNNIVEFGEDCDGSALNGETCESQGFDGGTLSCSPGCEFDLSECVNFGPDEGSIVFSGTAYPWSIVRILKDGQVAATTIGDAGGNFETTLSNLTAGSYLFAVFAYDSSGEKSKTLTYQKDIIKNSIQTVSEIVIPPTLKVDQESVAQGRKINFSGTSAALAGVSIMAEPKGLPIWFSATANGNGFYSYKLDTNLLAPNVYTARAKTILNETSSSPYGGEISFQITPKPAPSVSTQVIDSLQIPAWRCMPRTVLRRPYFSGATNIPDARVRIEIRNIKNKLLVWSQTIADSDGNWLWIEPTRLKRKTYRVYITASDPDDVSRSASSSYRLKIVKKIKRGVIKKCWMSNSQPYSGNASGKGLSSSAKSPDKNADLNGDGRVNLVDESIFVDYFHRGEYSTEVDLNSDGKVDLIDFSILMFYWTG